MKFTAVQCQGLPEFVMFAYVVSITSRLQVKLSQCQNIESLRFIV